MIDRDSNPDFLNSFLDYSITILNKSPNSVKEYNYDIAMFLKYIMIRFKLTKETDYSSIDISKFNVSTLKKISLDDIHAFVSHLAVDNKSKATTRARKVSTIRIFFKYLSEKEKVLKINPAQNLETPKLDKRIPKYLSLDDSRKLLNIAADENNRNKERDFAIITLFLNCGLRLSELVGINIKDIDFGEYKLNVIGKGNKERTIYLNKACINAINDYLAVRPREGVKVDSKHSEKALFLSEQRKRISNRTVQYIVDKELAKAGLDTTKYSVHKLRHTAATLMYQYGNVDIRALQELLGHESISTTEIYTHVNNEQVRNAVESNPLADM
ncbi:MAG: tyrosine recombinase XerC [Clostridia bacterium]|nr:tyrosine recombinase XerC [Clostridia bacterium]